VCFELINCVKSFLFSQSHILHFIDNDACVDNIACIIINEVQYMTLGLSKPKGPKKEKKKEKKKKKWNPKWINRKKRAKVKKEPPLEKERTTDKKRERERERERERRRRRRRVGAYIFCRLSFPVRLEGR